MKRNNKPNYRPGVVYDTACSRHCSYCTTSKTCAFTTHPVVGSSCTFSLLCISFTRQLKCDAATAARPVAGSSSYSDVITADSACRLPDIHDTSCSCSWCNSIRCSDRAVTTSSTASSLCAVSLLYIFPHIPMRINTTTAYGQSSHFVL
ncbi:hypothetical protein BDR07DRAFT_286344 [Suillus spraguei]|nr:hypothetical protein BDR07DRAFT_286344 [Suillus spraguei]